MILNNEHLGMYGCKRCFNYEFKNKQNHCLANPFPHRSHDYCLGNTSEIEDETETKKDNKEAENESRIS